MQLGSVGLAVDAPTVGWSLGPWSTARGQPLTGGPRIPLGHSSVSIFARLAPVPSLWHRCHRYGQCQFFPPMYNVAPVP